MLSEEETRELSNDGRFRKNDETTNNINERGSILNREPHNSQLSALITALHC